MDTSQTISCWTLTASWPTFTNFADHSKMENVLAVDKKHFYFYQKHLKLLSKWKVFERSQATGSSPGTMALLQIGFKQTLGCFRSLPTSVAKNAARVSIDPFPFSADLPRPLGGVHHSAYFSYQNRNVCLFPHCLNLISPPPLPTSLSVTPLLLSPFLCSHSKLKEGERAREKRLFSCKRHRDERLPTQSVIAGKMGVMYL